MNTSQTESTYPGAQSTSEPNQTLDMGTHAAPLPIYAMQGSPGKTTHALAWVSAEGRLPLPEAPRRAVRRAAKALAWSLPSGTPTAEALDVMRSAVASIPSDKSPDHWLALAADIYDQNVLRRATHAATKISSPNPPVLRAQQRLTLGSLPPRFPQSTIDGASRSMTIGLDQARAVQISMPTEHTISVRPVGWDAVITVTTTSDIGRGGAGPIGGTSAGRYSTERLRASAMAERIRARLLAMAPSVRPAKITVRQVATLLGVAVERVQSHRRSIGQAMRALGCERRQRRVPGGAEYYYVVPEALPTPNPCGVERGAS